VSSSAKGVRDVMPNSNAGRETRKKLIQGSPASGNPLALPEANPMKITLK
jgi:hypothetical protein